MKKQPLDNEWALWDLKATISDEDYESKITFWRKHPEDGNLHIKVQGVELPPTLRSVRASADGTSDVIRTGVQRLGDGVTLQLLKHDGTTLMDSKEDVFEYE